MPLTLSVARGVSLGLLGMVLILVLAQLVGIPGFDSILEGGGFRFECLNCLFLLLQSCLHRVEHAHLFLFELLDGPLSVLLHRLVLLHDGHILLSGACVVLRLVVPGLAHLLLPVVVHFRRIALLFGVVGQLLLKEVVVVRLKDRVQVLLRVKVRLEDLVLVLPDIVFSLVAAFLIDCVLVRDSQFFLLAHVGCKAIVGLFAFTGRVR